MLWERVNAVTVFTSLQPRVMMSSDSTNRRWSRPVRMCSTPRTPYVRATSSVLGAASTTSDGAKGVSRVTCVEPSRRSRRTSTSVVVAMRPAMWMVPPISPPAHFAVHRSENALLTIDARGALRFVQPAGSFT